MKRTRAGMKRMHGFMDLPFSMFWKMECFFEEESKEYYDFLRKWMRVTVTGSVQDFDEYIVATKQKYGRDILDVMVEEMVVLAIHCVHTDAEHLRQRLEIFENHGIKVAHSKGFEIACSMGDDACSYAAVLIDLGASPGGTYLGTTVMEDAIYHQQVAIIELLLRAGAESSGYIYGAHTSGDKSETIVRLMLDHGADLTQDEDVADLTDGILGDINALHETWKTVFPDFHRELIEYVFAPARLARIGYFDI